MLLSLSRLSTCFAAALVLLAPAVAFAEEEPRPYPECSKEPTDAEVNAAKGAFQAGSAAFDEADYPRAVVYWEDAYRRDCTANPLLLNLARAYELAGQKRHAILALETFLAREPNTHQKEQIFRRIDVLKKQLESEQPDSPSAAPPPPSNATSTSAAETATIATPPPDAVASKGKKPITPLLVAGAGGLALIGGGVLFLIGSNESEDVNSQCYHRDCGLDPNKQPRPQAEADKLSEEGNAARTKQVIGGVLMGVGGAAAIGGVVWYLLAPRKTEQASYVVPKRTLELNPLLSPGFSGVSLNGTF